MALIVSTAVVGYVYLNTDPVISGTEPAADAQAVIGPPELSLPPVPVSPVSLPASKEAAEGDAEAVTAAAPIDPNVLTGRWAMLFNVMLLKNGCERFEKVNDYRATLYKQERIGGELGEGQTTQLKVRHEPFSVYMKWLTGDRGRQLIYVDGQNDGNMLIQLGGVKGRLLGVLQIDPNGAQSKKESRYPITGAGLLNMARKILQHRERDLANNCEGVHCEVHDDQMLNDRPCYLFVTTYDSPDYSETYRKSMLYVDKELSLPVCVRNYTWAVDADPEKLDEQTLIEFYSYSDIETGIELADPDFDAGNRKYRMRR